jgi:UDP-3-O-[3-hydroxymyristoyl] glucosamine N-acyltransferase
MKLTVAQLAERIGAELVGDGRGQISAVGAVEAAGENDVTFITNDKHIPQLKKSRAGAVIVGRRIEDLVKPQLVVKNVDAALIEVLSIKGRN